MNSIIKIHFDIVVKGIIAVIFNLTKTLTFLGSREGSVDVATHNGVEGLGIENLLGARFSAYFQTVPGAHPASCSMHTVSFTRVMRPEPDAYYTPFSSAEVANGSETYLLIFMLWGDNT